VKIDTWTSSDILIIQIDSIKYTFSSSLITSSNICGQGDVEYVNKITANVTHSSPTMSLVITTSMSTSFLNYDKSFGIYDLFILIDYVSSSK